ADGEGEARRRGLAEAEAGAGADHRDERRRGVLGQLVVDADAAERAVGGGRVAALGEDELAADVDHVVGGERDARRVVPDGGGIIGDGGEGAAEADGARADHVGPRQAGGGGATRAAGEQRGDAGEGDDEAAAHWSPPLGALLMSCTPTTQWLL